MAERLISTSFEGLSPPIDELIANTDGKTILHPLPGVTELVWAILSFPRTDDKDARKLMRIKSMHTYGLNGSFMLPITCYFTQINIFNLLVTNTERSSLLDTAVYELDTGFVSELRLLGFSHRDIKETELLREGPDLHVIQFFYPLSLTNFDCNIGYLDLEMENPINLVCIFRRLRSEDKVGLTFVVDILDLP
jgi:hypothetical protein